MYIHVLYVFISIKLFILSLQRLSGHYLSNRKKFVAIGYSKSREEVYKLLKKAAVVNG